MIRRNILAGTPWKNNTSTCIREKKKEKNRKLTAEKSAKQWLHSLFPPGLEPRTFRVLGERDNHYTTETGDNRWKTIILHRSLIGYISPAFLHASKI